MTAYTATLVYSAIAVAMTWPLAAGLARDIPWDLGDSLLNCWILGWTATHLLRLLTGDFSAAREFWHANIFYPEPLTLAYSEHLTAQAIQILPLYAVTGNLVLCYNLLFLSTFVLSALGAYLLVRDITGSPRAAFVAGLFYGFAPYRVAQSTHLQVLSSHWMPFALLGLRRYLDTGRVLPLVGATVALVAQNLSCGYYLLFFSPFVGLYCVWELWARKRLRDLGAWRALAAAGAVTVAATWPFLQGYRDLRAIGDQPRTMQEVIAFSADVYSYFTTFPALRLWGDVAQAFPKAEGELFPGAVPIALAIVAVGWQVRRAWRDTTRSPQATGWDRARRAVVIALAIFAALNVAAMVVVMAGHGGVTRLGPVTIRMSSFYGAFGRAVLALAATMALSARARAAARRFATSPTAWFAIAAAIAAWLSLGPIMHTAGRRIAEGPYLYLHEYLPGFDGLRVPARFAMIVMLFLSVLAGLGAAAVERKRKRGAAAVLMVGALFLVEGWAGSIPLNVVWAEADLRPPPPRMRTGRQTPAVYRFVRTLPADAVLIEFPFGATGYELQYMFYSTTHWRRLLNGYSGMFPRSYAMRQTYIGRYREDPDTAWRALAMSGARYAIVHETAYPGREAEALIGWLERGGARRVKAFGRDVLFALPPR